MTSAALAGISYRTGTDHPHGYMTAALASDSSSRTTISTSR